MGASVSCIPESEIRGAVQPKRRGDVIAVQKFSSHGLVKCIRSVDTVPAQVPSWISTITVCQVYKLKANNACVAAGHIRIEVVVPARSTARLQGLSNIVTPGICEHVEVDTVEVAVVEVDVRIPGPQVDHRFLEEGVVIACDSVDFLVTASTVIAIGRVVGKQGEHGRNASQWRQIDH